MPTKSLKDHWIQYSIREISIQARFAAITYSHIDPKARSNDIALFSSIHSFLAHCAMISKMLTFKYIEDTTPRTAIAGVLGILPSSLLNGRIVRTHLEHYHHRLQQWLREDGVNRMIGDYNVGPRKALNIQNMLFVRHYDPDGHMFTFRNEDFDLAALSVETERIGSLADNWLQDVESRKKTPPFS